MLSSPFQCNECWFWKLRGQQSNKINPTDGMLLRLIRRANLDMMWSRIFHGHSYLPWLEDVCKTSTWPGFAASWRWSRSLASVRLHGHGNRNHHVEKIFGFWSKQQYVPAIWLCKKIKICSKKHPLEQCHWCSRYTCFHGRARKDF